MPELDMETSSVLGTGPTSSTSSLEYSWQHNRPNYKSDQRESCHLEEEQICIEHRVTEHNKRPSCAWERAEVSRD